MIKRFSLFITILFIFSFSVLSAAVNIDPDDLLAVVYLKHAAGQFDSYNFEEAYSLADISLTFKDTSSDALLIRGVSSRKSGNKNSSITDLSAAIIRNNWEYYNETTARVYLSEYMYFAGDIESAYINLQPFSNDLTNDSYFTEIYIRMALSLGKIDEAVQSAENLLIVDPYDSYSQLIMSLYDSEWLLRAEKILLEGDPAKYFSKDVVRSIIERSSECDYLIEFYKNRWGEDRFIKISNISYRKDQLKELLGELYPENTVVTHNELTRVYSLIEDESRRNLVYEQLNSINLTISYDIDNDGFTDTEAVFSNGNPVTFSFDSNQDNLYDQFVGIADQPVSLIIKEKGKTRSFFYESYPNLITVTVSDEISLTEYQLIPYTLDLDIIKIPLDIINDIPHILNEVSFPDNDTLTASSTEKNKNNFITNLVSNYVRIKSDESIENIFESDGTKIVERHFRNSILIKVFRDLDSDGVFDTIYDYKNGLLQAVAFDANNNGIAEYMENYEKGLVRSWDFNEDGLLDSKERYDNGIIYRELSSELNGIFDTILEINSDVE